MNKYEREELKKTYPLIAVYVDSLESVLECLIPMKLNDILNSAHDPIFDNPKAKDLIMFNIEGNWYYPVINRGDIIEFIEYKTIVVSDKNLIQKYLEKNLKDPQYEIYLHPIINSEKEKQTDTVHDIEGVDELLKLIEEQFDDFTDKEKVFIDLRYGLHGNKIHSIDEISTKMHQRREIMLMMDSKIIRIILHGRRKKQLSEYINNN